MNDAIRRQQIREDHLAIVHVDGGSLHVDLDVRAVQGLRAGLFGGKHFAAGEVRVDEVELEHRDVLLVGERDTLELGEGLVGGGKPGIMKTFPR